MVLSQRGLYVKQGMSPLGRFAIVLLFTTVVWSAPTNDEKNDGFLRLLRRSNPEADRPLIRQQRKASTDDDDDDFDVPVKSQDEDAFYKTLLSRTDSKPQPEKRSFDTEDVEAKEGIIIRQDWNGDSKITDADKRELESLFSTLNAADGEGEEKIEKVREAGEEPERPVHSAAKNYAEWLMEKPAAQMTAAISHKVDVDYELSKLLYARSSIPGKPCKDSNPECHCKITCYPYAVSKNIPCQCSPLMTKSVQPKQQEAVAKPKSIVTGPAVERKKMPLKGSGRAMVALPPLCHDNTANCLCSKACYPKQVVLAKPCECGAPVANVSAPPPSEHDQAHARSRSAPSQLASSSPAAVASPVTPDAPTKPYVSPVKTAHMTPIGHAMPAPKPMDPKAKPIAKADVPLKIIGKEEEAKLSKEANAVCSDATPSCVCAKACFPRPVSSPNPCECGVGPAPPPPPPPSGGSQPATNRAIQPVEVPNKGDIAWCTKACHPRTISKARPCECALGNLAAPNTPAKSLSSPSALNQPAISQVGNPMAEIKQQQPCARKCVPGKPCDCEAGGSPNPPPPSPAPAPAPALATAFTGHSQAITFQSPCARKCVPGKPCDCEAGGSSNPPPPPPSSPPASAFPNLVTPHSNPARPCNRKCLPGAPCDCEAGGASPPPPPPPAPSPASFAPQIQAANSVCAKKCYPQRVVRATPCDCEAGGSSPPPPPPPSSGGSPSSAFPIAPYPYNRKLAYFNAQQTQNLAQYWNRPAQQRALYGAQFMPYNQRRVPYPSGVRLSNFAAVAGPAVQPAGSAALAAARSTFLEKKALGISQLAKVGPTSYQGCYKDMKPVRDLPRRYTRYGNVMTPEACVNECKYQGYKFAGAQYGYLCFCGNSFGRYGRVDDKQCNARCYGDQKSNCGAFWHNSVYSVDGKEYDPTDFDFKKIDAEEARKDQLANTKTPGTDSSRFPSKVKSQVAEHLMKAAEAALKAAKKLIPDGKRSVLQGKHKREDDADDEEYQENKLASMASLGAAQQLLEKERIVDEKKHNEKEKRSADLDTDIVNPDNGKDLLVAYLGGLEEYNRRTRSVEDDEDESGSGNESAKPEAERFAYTRVTLGESGDGEFVDKSAEKLEKDDSEDDDDSAQDRRRKRSVESSESQTIKESIKKGRFEKRSTKQIKAVKESKEVAKYPNKRSTAKTTAKEVIHRRSRRSLEESETNEDTTMTPNEPRKVKRKASITRQDESHTRSTRKSETDTYSEESYDEPLTPQIKKVNKREEMEEADLKSHVKEGVHSLVNLVVELYKQQKTIKAFEESVHSLKEDIVRNLDVPSSRKSLIMKQVRDEIKATAADELKALTSTIKSQIRQYGQSQPQLGHQASTAVALIPDLPVNKMMMRQAKREVERRSAELEVNVEDAFTTAARVPDLVKEHFKRNAEEDYHGEKMLSRSHRDVSDENSLDEDFKEIIMN